MIFKEKKNGDGFILRVFLGMSHQLGAKVADGKEVICPLNQLSVLLIEHRQAAGNTHRT